MSKFTTTHEINCNTDKFWATFFNKSVIEEVYLTVLGYPELLILDVNDRGASITQDLSIRPKMNMPGPLTKLLGTNYRYTEEGTFNKDIKMFTWKWIPSTLVDKIRLEGTIRVQPIDDSKIRLINEISVEAKVFGVGGLLESTYEKQIREENDAKAAYYNKVVVK